MLVFRDQRLMAIVSRLGRAHGAAAGRWFVEAMFTDQDARIDDTFATLSDVEARLAETVAQ